MSLSGDGFSACDSVSEVREAVLDAGISAAGAAYGNVQSINWDTGCLEIAAQRGFEPDFLLFFKSVKPQDDCFCGRALKLKTTVNCEDVANESGLTEDARGALLSAGVRALQSTPMIATNGTLVGMLSVHFSTAHRMSQDAVDALEFLARAAADATISKLGQKKTREIVTQARETVATSRDLLARIDTILLGSNRQKPM